jgi:REP element-mobilizing transposase RayT
MRGKRQPSLLGFGKLDEKEFGGSRLRGNPREQRPIAVKRPMHLVMRSTLARGERSFLRKQNARRIETLVRKLGKEKGVNVYRFANSGNHLHFVVLPSSRPAFRAYVRAVSGLIARISLGVERGTPKGLKFWDARPYTRIVEWGRDFKSVCDYVLQNTLEAIGFIAYQPRENRKERKTRKRGPPRSRRSPYPI